MESTDNLQAKDRVDRISSTEFGQISILSSGYTLKLDSADEEIIEAHKYPKERVDEGHQVGFALSSDRSTQGQLPQFSSSLDSGLVEMRIVRNKPQRVYICLDLNKLVFDGGLH